MPHCLCIHAHFYQPPRENPWVGAIEPQSSAAPWPNWNARIAEECYAPLTRSGSLSLLSFNFGPTLLSWLERHRPDVYTAILAADRAGLARFGRGPATAQAHGHIILPLANPRDRRTQVLWGIRDFEHRFGRKPEGMWLPETAADTPSLEALAEQGIAFTVLAPHQARAIRAIGRDEWLPADEFDTSRPYCSRLPSGRTINLFFYHGPAAHTTAFGDVLDSPDAFTRHLLGQLDGAPGLHHIATDGETYGHHKGPGAVALIGSLRTIERDHPGTFTNYSAHLAEHPPTHEAQIAEGTSWSCTHGIERWRADCGCHTGAHPEWSQAWRAPLRGALDWLRDRAAAVYERVGGDLLRDPWAARDDSLSLSLFPGEVARRAFIARHAVNPAREDDRDRIFTLLELQRHAMLMFTSCAWFFDDPSGLEPRQVLQSAARVVELVREAADEDLEPGLLERLARAPGNTSAVPDARRAYELAKGR